MGVGSVGACMVGQWRDGCQPTCTEASKDWIRNLDVSCMVFTVDDFWLDVSHWKARKNGYVMQNLLYKKDIINFLRTFYCGIKLNFKGMQKDGVISFHGKRPHEHFVLNPPYANHVQRQMPYNRMLPPFHHPIFFLTRRVNRNFIPHAHLKVSWYQHKPSRAVLRVNDAL